MKKKKSARVSNNLDAVKLMREIRDNLSRRYNENPELESSDLKKIRRKYKIKVKQKTKIA